MRITLGVVLILTLATSLRAQTAPAAFVTHADANAAMDAFNSKFWNPQKNWYLTLPEGKGDATYWTSAHLFQLLLDAYERRHDPRYLEQARTLHKTFISRHGRKWEKNRWNDDIMWWVLASLRAHRALGEKDFLDDARNNFDWIWQTQHDDVLGGGIYEHNNKHVEKNACINFPAVIAAAELYAATKDKSYLDKSVTLYTWSRKTFYDGKGAVADKVFLNSTLDGGPTHYNQGTFIGAAARLYLATGEKKYLDDAVLAAEWTRKHLATDDILRYEAHKDLQGGKLILIHHLRTLIVDCRQSQFLPWLENNARAILKNRSSEGLVSGEWQKPTTGNFTSWAAAPAVALLQFLAK